MRQNHLVAGEDVVLHVLPRHTHPADEAWQRFCASDPILGLDVETTAAEGEKVDPLNPTLKCRMIQFGNKTEAWALDVHDPFWRKRIKRLLRSEDTRFVSHTEYDPIWVKRELGIDLGDRSIDTKVLADMRWPGITAAKDLKSLSDRYIDHGLTAAQTLLYALFADLYYAQTVTLPKSWKPGDNCRVPGCPADSLIESRCGRCETHYFGRQADKNVVEWGFTNVPLDDPTFAAYAGLDAVYVRRLLDLLGREVKEWGMAALGRTEQKIRRLCTSITMRGHRVDRDWTENLLSDIETEYLDAEHKFREITDDVNPRSPKAKDWLVEHGMRYVVKTPKGAPKTDKDNLPILVQGNTGVVQEALQQLLDMSKDKNILTNLRIIEKKSRRDGFIHPRINTLQAHTARMSIVDPAMQTFKKDDKRLRGCFIAREGHTFVGADYDSQEIRIGAALSRDEALLKIVREGLSQHVLTAENLFDDFIDKIQSPRQYHKAKTLDFGQQYGLGPAKLQIQLGLDTYEEALEMWLSWRDTYAGLVGWSQRESEKPFIVNPFGRVIPRDPFRPYANSNYQIQSSGRDVLGAAMVELAEEGWGPHFWLPMHDELIMEVPVDRAEEAASALTKHMTFQFGDIPLPAEGEIIGPRWGGLKG